MVELLVAYALIVTPLAIVGLIFLCRLGFGKTSPQSASGEPAEAEPIGRDTLAAQRLVSWWEFQGVAPPGFRQQFQSLIDATLSGEAARMAPDNLSGSDGSGLKSSQPPGNAESDGIESDGIEYVEAELVSEAPAAGIPELEIVDVPGQTIWLEQDLHDRASNVARPPQVVPSARAAAASHEHDDGLVSAVPQQIRQSEFWDDDQQSVSIPKNRKSVSELLHAFMQERNMRWGELASGILIVLSAVGLVVSLRAELTNRIPYFSALSFMVLTASIHVAGVYTLRKWKLRNTSRGALFIGMFLIPLNFVAGCILSGGVGQRRELTDPLLWIAIGTGLLGFGLLAAWSGRYLFRFRAWPLTGGLMLAAVGTLLLNRTVPAAEHAWQILLASAPAGFGFILCSCFALPKQFYRQRISRRSAGRLVLFLGLAVYALLSALSLAIIRADSIWQGAQSVMPWFSVAAVGIVAIGLLLRKYSNSMHPVTHQFSIGNPAEQNSERAGYRLADTVILVLGLGLVLGIGLLLALDPWMLALHSLICGAGLWMLGMNQRALWLLPVAWVGLSISGVAGIEMLWPVVAGNLVPASIADSSAVAVSTGWPESLLHARAGLLLMVFAGICVPLHRWSINSLVGLDAHDKLRIMRWGQATAAVIGIAGLGLILLCSVLHRNDVFSNHVASILLAGAGLLLLARAAGLDPLLGTKPYGTDAESVQPDARRFLDHVACIFVLLASVHGCVWNLQVAALVTDVLGKSWFGWSMPILVTAALSSLAAVVAHRRRLGNGDAQDAQSWAQGTRIFSGWSACCAAILSLLATSGFYQPHFWPVVLSAVAGLSWAMLGQLWHRRFPQQAGVPLAWATWLTLVLAVLFTGQWIGGGGSGSPVARVWMVLGTSCIWLIGGNLVWRIFQRREIACQPGWQAGEEADRVLVPNPASVWWHAGISHTALALHWIAISFLGIVVAASVSSVVLQDEFWVLPQMLGQPNPVWLLVILGAMIASLMWLSSKSNVQYLHGCGVSWVLAWAYGAGALLENESAVVSFTWVLPSSMAVGCMLLLVMRKLDQGRADQADSAGWQRLWGIRESAWPWIMPELVVGTIASIGSVVIAYQSMAGGRLAMATNENWLTGFSTLAQFAGPIWLLAIGIGIAAVWSRRHALMFMGAVCIYVPVVLQIQIDGTRVITESNPLLVWTVLAAAVYGLGWSWLTRRGAFPALANTAGRAVLPATELHWLKMHGWGVTGSMSLIVGLIWMKAWQAPGQATASLTVDLAAVAVISSLGCGVLQTFAWREKLSARRSSLAWLCLLGWQGAVLVSLASGCVSAFLVQHPLGSPAVFLATFMSLVAVLLLWMAWGCVAPHASAWRAWIRGRTGVSISCGPGSNYLLLPGAVGLALSLVMAIRYLAAATPAIDWGGMRFVLLVAWAVMGNWLLLATLLRRAWMIPLATIVGLLWLMLDPWMRSLGTFESRWYATSMWVAFVSLVWNIGVHFAPRQDQRADQFRSGGAAAWLGGGQLLAMVLINLVLLVWSWMVDASVQWTPVSLANTMLLGCALVANFSNGQGKFRVASGLGFSLILVYQSCRMLPIALEYYPLVLGLATSGTLLVWSFCCSKLLLLKLRFKLFTDSEFEQLKASVGWQIPGYLILLGVPLLVLALVELLLLPGRLHHYGGATIVLLLAWGFGLQAISCEAAAQRRLQRITLLGLVLALVCFSWGDLPTGEWEANRIEFPWRALLVLAPAVWGYAALCSKWARTNSPWMASLRESAAICCGLALVCLAVGLLAEATRFSAELFGCGLSLEMSVMVALMLCLLAFGMVLWAVRPKLDPVALPLKQRIILVYLAEIVLLGLVVHCYLSMPWLFQFSWTKNYWPGLAMGCCFLAIGVVELLQKRQLQVLATPLLHTAVLTPCLVALACCFVESRIDLSLIVLLAGLIYLLVGYVRKSAGSAISAVIFGNIALWLFFEKHPGLAFLQHPQLWLIPPALSLLLAGELCRKNLSRQQISIIRYLSVTVVYTSSTAEIVMNGIGEMLWPPMVLALLSVCGILWGLLLQARPLVYFGTLFLLLSMVSMVAHAQQSLDHVWPWWAFGISLGLAVLVFFGWVEKRRNQLRRSALASEPNETVGS